MRSIRIGRNQDNDIVIQNDPFVSRYHCELISDDQGNCFLQDLNSTNGTYINGIRVNIKTLLHSGDRVSVGNTAIPWESYFPKQSAISQPVDYHKNNQDYTPSHEHSGNNVSSGTNAILTLLFGLLSCGIIVYLIFGYFTSLGYQLISAAEASTFKGFVLYLHGWFGVGGKWVLIIFAIVSGVVADVFAAAEDSDDHPAKSIGTVLGNIGLTIGIILLILTLFAEQIISA